VIIHYANYWTTRTFKSCSGKRGSTYYIVQKDLIVRIISSILGSMIVGATGILQLTKAQESWIVFRSTAETLKKEYNLYMLKAGDYSDSNLIDEKRDRLFIERSESIMAMKGTKYFSLRQKSEPSTKNSS
jgi:hypothetical protein